MNLGGSNLGSYIIDPGFRPRLPLPLELQEDGYCLLGSFTPPVDDEKLDLSGLAEGDSSSSAGVGLNAGMAFTNFLFIF